METVMVDSLQEKVACITLDLESDYAGVLNEPRYEGLNYVDELVGFLKQEDIPLTCFVQGSIFETHPSVVRQLSVLDTEFELHSYSHPQPEEMDTELEIIKGQASYRSFFGEDPIGYRSPFGVVDEKLYSVLASHGFKFDSSIFPSFRPRIFSNLSKPTRPYFVSSGILEIPFTVFSNVIRVPIALSYLKLLGRPYLYLLKVGCLPNLIVFDFHLHDLFALNSFQELPFYGFSIVDKLIYKRAYQGKKDGLSTLREFAFILQRKGYTFSKLLDIYQTVNESGDSLCKQS